jgi:glyoxylase-like metal-dependent hydrolase (beta-lactamase superfamily II)
VAIRLSSWLDLIDTFQFGLPGIGAAYLLHGERSALIDTGTPHATSRVKEAVGSTALDFILLTHIHVDHAGSAASVAVAYPEAVVCVHESGLKHLEDPSRINESVAATTGPLADLYGVMEPLDPERIRVLRDGDQIDLGKRLVIEAIYTPGHAPHHFSFFEQSHRALFCGDAVGTRRFGNHLPATVPPAFNLKESLESLNRLAAYHPDRLYFSHFGRADHPSHVLESCRVKLCEWVRLICRYRRDLTEKKSMSNDDIVAAITALPEFGGLQEPLRWELAMSVRGVLQYLERIVG